MIKLITDDLPSPRMPSVAMQNDSKEKRRLVSRLRTRQKSRELEFNLSRTFENHLKQLVNLVDDVHTQSNSPIWWAGPDLNRRPSARQALILDQDTDWMEFREWLNSKNFVGRRCHV